VTGPGAGRRAKVHKRRKPRWNAVLPPRSSRRAGVTRRAGTILAAVSVACGLFGTTGVAGASSRSALRALPQVEPVGTCPSASAVSAAVGFKVPSPSAETASNTGTSAAFGKVTTTATVCSYISTTSLQSMHYSIVILGHLSKSISSGSVEAYLREQFSKANAKMPPGMVLNYKFGTQYGLPTVWISGKATFGTVHIAVNGAFSYKGGKLGGAEVINASQEKANKVEKLALEAVGIAG